MLVRTVVMAVALLLSGATADDRMEVQLQQGTIMGDKVPLGDSRHFYSFKGIPFAEPPVGDLRLRDPVKAGSWTGVRESITPPQCPQIALGFFIGNSTEVLGEEDCLYLNVYTPTPHASNLPVMVFIHGGGYLLGDADSFGGTPKRLLTRDIVLVSIQYRLGLLGFLSTEDALLPGNLGLKDQTMALAWVHDNIKSLGGDPGCVTIFGESAGSSSVHQHILTPMSRGLFHRAIMQSGNALSPWALRDDHRRTAGEIGQKLNCTGVTSSGSVKNSSELFTCLQKTPVGDLVMTTTTTAEWFNVPMKMVPRVDGEFLIEHPATQLATDNYRKVDIISGVTQHEGASMYTGLLYSNMSQELMERLPELGPLFTAMDQEESAESLTLRMFYKYLGNDQNLTATNGETMVQAFTDWWFRASHDKVMQLHARDAEEKNVYRYRLDYRGQSSFSDFFNTGYENDKWVSHADDLTFLFNDVMFAAPLERHGDVFMSDIMVSLWTNFAATGEPTPDLSLGFRWRPISPWCQQYLSLSLAPTMQPDDFSQIREFYNDLPTKVNKILYPERFSRTPDHGCVA